MPTTSLRATEATSSRGDRDGRRRDHGHESRGARSRRSRTRLARRARQERPRRPAAWPSGSAATSPSALLARADPRASHGNIRLRGSSVPASSLPGAADGGAASAAADSESSSARQCAPRWPAVARTHPPARRGRRARQRAHGERHRGGRSALALRMLKMVPPRRSRRGPRGELGRPPPSRRMMAGRR